MRLRSTPLLVTALVWLGACSSATVGDTITVEQACSELATARCSLRSNCNLPDGARGVGFGVRELYGDMPTCLAREALACTSALTAPQTGNTPGAVQLCVRAFMTYSCADFLDNVPPLSCTPAGPRASGAPCAFDSQCQTGVCNGVRAAVCGTCGDPPGLGEDCSASTCARGARCLAAGETCAPLGATADACDDTHPCDRGLSCLVSGADTSGTCEIAGTRVGLECGGKMRGCDATRGLFCAGAPGSTTCQPLGLAGTMPDGDGGVTAANPDGGPTVPTPAGTPCGVLADGSRIGCVAGTCVPQAAAGLGACVPFAPDGYPCDTAAGPGCMPPARCVPDADGTAGTCMIPNGADCPG
ncbi:MAG TPA: hypothetical protein VHO67_06820 [Polyangia bacterium]|nr:hypothetical protein [Polyangia bacterium]